VLAWAATGISQYYCCDLCACVHIMDLYALPISVACSMAPRFNRYWHPPINVVQFFLQASRFSKACIFTSAMCVVVAVVIVRRCVFVVVAVFVVIAVYFSKVRTFFEPSCLTVRSRPT